MRKINKACLISSGNLLTKNDKVIYFILIQLCYKSNMYRKAIAEICNSNANKAAALKRIRQLPAADKGTKHMRRNVNKADSGYAANSKSERTPRTFTDFIHGRWPLKYGNTVIKQKGSMIVEKVRRFRMLVCFLRSACDMVQLVGRKKEYGVFTERAQSSLLRNALTGKTPMFFARLPSKPPSYRYRSAS